MDSDHALEKCAHECGQQKRRRGAGVKRLSLKSEPSRPMHLRDGGGAFSLLFFVQSTSGRHDRLAWNLINHPVTQIKNKSAMDELHTVFGGVFAASTIGNSSMVMTSLHFRPPKCINDVGDCSCTL